jgi:deoxyribonuclease-4
MIYIGNHVSSSKGYEAMGKQEVALGGDTFAFFTRNPRGGSAKEIKDEDVQRLLTLMKDHSFGPLVAHAPYTMNVCAAKEDIRKFSVEMLKDDIRRMEYLPGAFYNFHPGSHVGQGSEAGIELIAAALNECISSTQSVTILLETMAGKGSEVGRSFEELKEIMDRVSCKEKLGVCFDTCHVNDAGYDLVNHYDEVFAEFDRVIGLDQIAVFHINDSMNPLGAHKDRHANIDKGNIGYETLHRLVHDERFLDVPKILETPWVAVEGTDKKEPPYKEEIAWLLEK